MGSVSGGDKPACWCISMTLSRPLLPAFKEPLHLQTGTPVDGEVFNGPSSGYVLFYQYNVNFEGSKLALKTKD